MNPRDKQGEDDVSNAERLRFLRRQSYRRKLLIEYAPQLEDWLGRNLNDKDFLTIEEFDALQKRRVNQGIEEKSNLEKNTCRFIFNLPEEEIERRRNDNSSTYYIDIDDNVRNENGFLFFLDSFLNSFGKHIDNARGYFLCEKLGSLGALKLSAHEFLANALNLLKFDQNDIYFLLEDERNLIHIDIGSGYPSWIYEIIIKFEGSYWKEKLKTFSYSHLVPST